MGVLRVDLSGSFPTRSKTFGAMAHGHAAAVAEAIAWLATDILPDAIAQDHKLHSEGATPNKGFGK